MHDSYYVYESALQSVDDQVGGRRKPQLAGI